MNQMTRLLTFEENEGSGGEIVDGARPTTVALGGVKLASVTELFYLVLQCYI